MTAWVPAQRSNPRYQEVQISAAVRGRLWQETASLYHWLRAHGQHVIPAHSPRVELATGESRTLRWMVRPSGTAIARLWSVVLRGVYDGYQAGQVRITYPDGREIVVTPRRGTVPGYSNRWSVGGYYTEELTAKSGELQELSIDVEWVDGNSEATVWIESVSCCEVPRPLLSQGFVDLGVDMETLRPAQAIFDAESYHQSVTALARNLADTERRRSLLQHAHTTATMPAAESEYDLYRAAVSVVPQKVQRSDTTRLLEGWVYARVDDTTTTAEITLATGSDSDAITIDGSVDGTSFFWVGPFELDADCEDLSTDDGDGGDTLQVRVKTTGTGNCQIETESVVEALVATGESGFDGSTYYAQALNATMVGDAAGFMRTALLRLVTGGVTQVVLHHRSGTGGYELYVNSSNQMVARIADGGTFYEVTSAALSEGRVYPVTMAFDGSDVSLVVGQTTHTPTAGTFTASATQTAALGSTDGGGGPCTGIDIVGAGAADGFVETEAQVLERHRQWAAVGDVRKFEGCQNLYSARFGLHRDRVGGANWTANGTTTVETFVPVMG